MKPANTVRLPILSLCLAATAAQAEWRCDCTTVIDSCAATVTVEDAWVDVTSDHEQCARVDYFIDGIPLVALVVGGEERQNWLTRNPNPDILIQSCQVCLDRSSETRPPAASPDGDGALTPVIEVEPDYPESAASRGIEGFAEVSFTVTPYGEVQDPRIASAEPEGVFDQAALNAISRWRYMSDEAREPATITHRFDFELGAELMALAPTQAAPATARPRAGQRNQCVREGTSYNYGEMVEVALINACEDPVVVYSCAEGTGRFTDQWVCTSSDERRQALVPPGDGRIGTAGTVALDGSAREFEYAGEMFVARAPNTQYWWLACAIDDAGCRTSGEQWLRGLDRQLASVDPRDRIARPLARAN